MDWLTILIIAMALGMDAFAVSFVSGATIANLTRRHYFRLGWHFGLFQFLMTILGWLGGSRVAIYIQNYDHWVAFGLLSLIGVRMIYQALTRSENYGDDLTRGWTLFSLSVATSIDALAVGFSFSLIGIPVLYPALMIGVIAALLSLLAVFLGRTLTRLSAKYLEITGGLLLILIGLKILFSHLHKCYTG